MNDTAIDRDGVLLAFHLACRRPSADDVATWSYRHPSFGDDIRAHAEAMLACIQDAHLAPEPTQDLLDRTRLKAMAIVERAGGEARAHMSAKDLPMLIMEAGTDVPRLARTLGLGRAPLVDLVKGRVRLPLPLRALTCFADALGTSVAAVGSALMSMEASRDTAVAANASTAQVPRRALADIVRTDPEMSHEQKSLWLDLLIEE